MIRLSHVLIVPLVLTACARVPASAVAVPDEATVRSHIISMDLV